jgi:hypothetical protein
MDIPAGAVALMGFAAASLILMVILLAFCVHYLRRNAASQAFLAIAVGPARPLVIHDKKNGLVSLHLEEADRRRWYVGSVRALPRRGRLRAAEPIGLYDKGELAEYRYGKLVKRLSLGEKPDSDLFKVVDVRALEVTIQARANRRVTIRYVVDV